jgi:hypothetical protein
MAAASYVQAEDLNRTDADISSSGYSAKEVQAGEDKLPASYLLTLRVEMNSVLRPICPR